MTSIYHTLIILPLIFLILIAFVFSSNLREIKLQQFVLNCPFPIYNADAPITNATITETASGWLFSYSYTTNNATQNQDGKYFHCFIDRLSPPVSEGGQPAVSIINKEYGAAVGNCATFCIPYGYTAYLADNIVAFFVKATPLVTILITIFNAPAIVTGLAWFSYINIVLILFIAIGIFMMIRGSG